MSDFCETPMSPEFVRTGIPEGGPGKFDGEDEGPFGSYKRTHSPNGVREKIRDGSVKKPEGESDQF